VKTFKMVHLLGGEKEFDEDTAPHWLKYGGPVGSTMDNRWFWEGHVMKLEIGDSVSTDFWKITRVS